MHVYLYTYVIHCWNGCTDMFYNCVIFVILNLKKKKKKLRYVRLDGVMSSAICTNTGVPQGTLLAPFLFSLYTADCRSTDESCPVVKFGDDTELVGKI